MGIWTFGVVLSLCSQAAIRPPVDARLSRAIEVRCSHARLDSILARLSQDSGVELRCQPDLGGRRVVLFAQRQPLKEVMDRLAGLVATPPGKAGWKAGAAGPDGTPGSYLLREDRRSRISRQNAAKRLRQERYQRARQRLEDAIALSSMDEESLARYRERYPNLVSEMGTYRGLIKIVGGVLRGELEGMLRGAPVDLPYGSLAADQQELVRTLVASINVTTPGQSFHGATDFPQTRLEIRLTGTPERPGIFALIQCIPEKLGTGCPDITNPPYWDDESTPGWLREIKAAEAAGREAKRLRIAPDEPALSRRVTIRRMVVTGEDEAPRRPGEHYCTLSEALKQLATQSGLPVMADYDPCFVDYYGRRGSRQLDRDLEDWPVWKALDYFADRFEVTWKVRKGWIIVRSPRAIYAEADGLDLSPPWEPQKKPGQATIPAPGKQ